MKPKTKVFRFFPLDPVPLTKIGPYTLPLSDGTPGQFLSTDGSYNMSWDTPAGGKSLYAAVVGSAAQVTAKVATHSSLQAAIDAVSSGDAIFILTGTYSETITINKQLSLLGEGHGTVINGTVNIQSGSDYSLIKFVKFTDNVVIDSGATGNIISEFWLASGKTITDNSTDELIFGMGE